MSKASPDTPAPPCPDPERIWLEPCTMSDGWGTCCDRNAWRDPSGVEYVRADLYEAERSRANAWAVQSVEAQEQIDDGARRIADLERQLAEAQQRAGLFEGLPWPCQVEWYTEGREDEEAFVLQKNQDGTFALLVIDPTDPHSTIKIKVGTRSECLAALRSELAGGSGDE